MWHMCVSVCKYRVHKTTDLLVFRLVANEDVASETSSQPFTYICNTNTLQKHYKVQALLGHRLYMKFICMIIIILDIDPHDWSQSKDAHIQYSIQVQSC